MAILRKAFVKVEPDTSKFDKELKDKLKKTDTKPEGDKVGKEFSSSLTRRIDRELKAFDLPKLDLKANPADAIKAIESTSRRLEALRDDADSIELRVQANKALGDLGRFRKTLGDAGPDLGATLGVSTSRGFFASLGASFKAPPPAVYAGVGVLGAALTPTLAAAVSGAVVGGVGVGGVIGGVVLAARDERVKVAGQSLGAFILGDLSSHASGFVPVVLDGIDDIRAGWSTLGPDLDRIFASSRFVDPLVAGAISGGRRVVAGLADAIDAADPVVASLGAAFDRLGDAAGDTLSLMAEDADEGASAIDDLTMSMANFIRVTGGIVHAAAVVKGWSDQVDIAIDKGRFWLEDWMSSGGVLEGFGIQLDLTADGFKAGTVEAEAYRKAVTGTAEAADFATLKAAGMTDAEIAAADASGTFAAKTDEVNAALGKAAGHYIDTTSAADRLKQQTQLLGEIQGVAAQEMDALLTRTGAVTGAMDAQRTMADLLRTAHDKMFGSIIKASEANEGYESSWDNLSGSVETNGRSLNIHTEKGRANRDALEGLLTSTGELFYAEIETGTSVAEATKKHQDRTAAIKEEAKRLGLNKTETEKLIATYGQIPPTAKTDLMLDGLQEIGKALTDLYIFQRSLASGRTLAQVRSDLFGGYAGNPAVFKAEGGAIEGPGTGTSDSVPVWASAGEHMWTAREVQAAGGHDAMLAMRQAAISGAFKGAAKHAKGGPIDKLVGKNWGSTLRYETNVRGTRVPSREEVANKVTPEFGSWPSSPAAQRGDSGVWRQIMAMVRGSGIPYTFGNAYRAGDPLWHGSGRAVDFMGFNQDRLASFFMARQSKVLELIHRTGNRDYAVTRGRKTTMPTQLPLHRNHLHVAMDNGGELAPGWNPPIYNGTGRPEPVTPAPIMDKVIDELRGLRKDLVRLPVYQVPDAGRRADLFKRGG